MNRRLAACLICCLMAGCGGGSSGDSSSGPTASTLSFPIGVSLANLNSNGFSAPFNITGKLNGQSESGSGTISLSPDSATTFEGQQALVSTLSITGNRTDSQGTVPFGDTVQGYTDTNYNVIGAVSGSEYDVIQGSSSHPASVKVGDTGVIGTLTRYNNSSKTVLLGTVQESYIIEADTDTSAIVDFIANQYDTNGTETQGTQVRYRIYQIGLIPWLSTSYTYLTGSTTGTLTLTNSMTY